MRASPDCPGLPAGQGSLEIGGHRLCLCGDGDRQSGHQGYDYRGLQQLPQTSAPHGK